MTPNHIPENLPAPADPASALDTERGPSRGGPKDRARQQGDVSAQQAYLSPTGGAGGLSLPGGPVSAAVPGAGACRTGRSAGVVPGYTGAAVKRVGLQGAPLKLDHTLAWFETAMPEARQSYASLARRYNATRDFQSVANKAQKETLAAIGPEYKGMADGSTPLKDAMQTRGFRQILAGIQAARDEIAALGQERLTQLQDVKRGTAKIRAAVERGGIARSTRDADLAEDRLAGAKGRQQDAVDAAKAAGETIGEVIEDSVGACLDPTKVPELAAKWVGKGIGAALGMGMSEAVKASYQQEVDGIEADIAAIRARIAQGVDNLQAAEIASGKALIDKGRLAVGTVDLKIKGAWNKVTNGFSLLAGDVDGANPQSMDKLQAQVVATKQAGDAFLSAALPVQTFLGADPLTRAERVEAVLSGAIGHTERELGHVTDKAERDHLQPALGALRLQKAYARRVASWRDCRQADVSEHIDQINTGAHMAGPLAIVDKMSELTGISRVGGK